MNILVTGGAGYIGSHACKLLAAKGHNVVVYDNLSTGWRDFVKWGDFVSGDTRDTDRLRGALRSHRIESVLHFAAKSTVDEAIRNPGEYFSNNVTGTLSLLEAMRDAWVEHIIVSGSAAVYGQPDRSPIPESAPAKPMNPYGESKLIMESMLKDFQKSCGLRWVSLRYFNAAGADPEGETGERHVPETHLVPRVLMAGRGIISELRIYGADYPTSDGSCVRDYIHVMDLAAAHVLALEYLAEGGTSMPMNLGAGEGLSVKEIVAAGEEVTGLPVPVVIGPRREGDPASLVADVSRAGQLLGWRPEYSSARGILTTAWHWMQKELQSSPAL